MTNLGERFVRVPQRARIASPSREARASCIDGVAKPTARTLRLPALHQPRPEMVAAATFILHVMSVDG